MKVVGATGTLTGFAPKAKHNFRMLYSSLPEALFARTNVESTLFCTLHKHFSVNMELCDVPHQLICYPPSPQLMSGSLWLSLAVKSMVIWFHPGESVHFILLYNTVAEAFNIPGADSLSLFKLPLSLMPQIGLGLPKQICWMTYMMMILTNKADFAL